MHTALFAQTNQTLTAAETEALARAVLTILLISLPFAIMNIIGLWKTFQKAGRPGWAAIVPFYNNYTAVKVANKPDWWFYMTLVPYVNLIMILFIGAEIARQFGKSRLFGAVVCGILGIGYVIIGFGNSMYSPVEDTDNGQIQDTPYPD